MMVFCDRQNAPSLLKNLSCVESVLLWRTIFEHDWKQHKHKYK
jgi:hypothetical protein